MATYKVTKTDTEEFVEEINTTEVKRTYHKQWLIDEIARLQVILAEFEE
ncbi:MAG: hypothetical protein ACYSSI_00375 [Planctomycetota bacterium]|jgi:hypothetical protein